jgi:hypothetical protein
MAFNIDSFSSTIGMLGGVQMSSKFLVRAYLPAALDSRNLEFMCETTSIPGMTIGSSPVKPHGYGSQYEAPLVPVYEDMPMSCIIDNSGEVTTLFADWQKAAVNYDYAPGEMNSEDMPFQVSYARDYQGLVEITTYSQEGRANRTISLHGAWPKTVGAVQLSWRERDTYSILPVTLTYRSWTSTDMRS